MALLVGVLACLRPVARADEPNQPAADGHARTLAAAAERFFKPLTEHHWAGVLVVGVVDERGTHVFGFGRQAEGKPEPPDGDAVFEIGSVTKVFTGALLADMAQRGLVSLDDPVNKLLPEDIEELRCGDREMRLVDLATHTSGLPRMPSNWKPQDPTDPYADYSADNLHDFLKQHAGPSLGKALGELFGTKPKQSCVYSNLGVGLLGHLLERKAGQPYEDLVVERICQPLGMTSTCFKLDNELTARLIAGHDADGSPNKNWNFACLAPCGGLRSTVNDLLKFVAANMGLTDSPLKTALAMTQQSHYEIDAKVSVGLNWFMKSDLVFHDGMTGGYNSLVVFSKSKKIGVVVLADTAIGGTSGLLNQVGFAFLKTLIGEKPEEPPQIRATAAVDRALLEKYAGSYSLVPLVATITVTCEEDKLFAQLTGQGRFRIFAESDSKFFYRIVDAQITFELDDSGQVVRLVLHQNGKDTPAGRVPESTKKEAR